MKKRIILVCILCIFSLLVSCGKNNEAGGEQTVKTTQASKVGGDTSEVSNESDQASERPNETLAKSSETSQESGKASIEAPKDDFSWPKAAAEKDFEFAEGVLTKYLGNGGVVVIPEKINGVPVKTIGSAFANQNSAITRVKIPEGVKTIENNAFYFNENMEGVSLPESLEAIDAHAFFNCSKIERIVIPAKVAVIGNEAFALTDPKEVYLLGKTPALGKNAFGFIESKERKIHVPDEEKATWDEVFGQACLAGGSVNQVEYPAAKGLEIDSSGNLTKYTGDDVVLRIPEEINGTQVKRIGEKAFATNTQLRQVTLPSTVEVIEENAFFATNIADFVFAEGLKEIKSEAFHNVHNLISLNLPKSLEKIGEKSFLGPQFNLLKIPENVKVIPASAFAQGNLEDVYLPEGIESIEDSAFAENANLAYLIFDGKVAPKIAKNAFTGSDNIEDIDINWQASKKDAEAFKTALAEAGLDMNQAAIWRADPPNAPDFPKEAKLDYDDQGLVISYEGDYEEMTMFWNRRVDETSDTKIPITGIGNNLFEKSKLKRFFVPHSGDFTTIGDRAFADSSLEEIYFFDSVTDIGKEAFSGTKIKEIQIPESVKNIGEGAFANCENLEKVVIDGAAKIGKEAFANCPKLTSLILSGKVTVGGKLGLDHESIRFKDDAEEADLQRLQKELEYPWYLSPLRVSEQGGLVKMPDTFKPNAEGDFEFDAATGVVKKYIGEPGSVVVPRQIQGVDVQGIGFAAFSNVTLASLAAGTSEKTDVVQVVLPETVKHIEDSAFLSCSGLEKLICYGPVERIGVRAFELCEGLKEADFVNGVKEMGDYTFNECKNLEKVNFNGKLDRLPAGAFNKCGFKGEVVLDYQEIGNEAFALCEGIETLRFSTRVAKIGDGAFVEVNNLKKAYFEGADAKIFEGGAYQFSAKAKDLKVILPASATQEQIDAFVSVMKLNLFENAEAMVVKE